MRWASSLAAVAILLLLPASAQAEQALTSDCNEPCGFIVPIIEIDVPDKQNCGGGRLIYADETPTDCWDMPANGESFTLKALVRISWDAQEEPTYPIMPDEPIIITFSGTQSNPKWLEMSFDPPSYEISTEDLYDPQYYDIDPDRAPIAYFDWVKPVNITFERTGDPSGAWLDKIEDRNGVVPTFMKVRTSSSGNYYREAFGVEEFRFTTVNDPEIQMALGNTEVVEPEEEAPGLPLVAVIGLLGAVALRRRKD